MTTLFDICKTLFVFLTLGILFLLSQGTIPLASKEGSGLVKMAIPAFLIFFGILIGYSIYLSSSTQGLSNQEIHNKRTNSYIQGIIIGILLSILYALIG